MPRTWGAVDRSIRRGSQFNQLFKGFRGVYSIGLLLYECSCSASVGEGSKYLVVREIKKYELSDGAIQNKHF